MVVGAKIKLIALISLFLPSFAYSQLKIAIVDTGLDLNDQRFHGLLCKDGHRDLTGKGINDTNGHGTHVAGLIAKTAGKGNYCFVIIKFYDSDTTTYAVHSFIHAAKIGVDIVNFSGGGKHFNETEYLLINHLTNITFVVAAGNDKKDLDVDCVFYPACYRKLKNVIAVGSKSNGVISKFSNYGTVVDAWENGEKVESFDIGSGQTLMSGTSQATAIHTGKLIKERLK